MTNQPDLFAYTSQIRVPAFDEAGFLAKVADCAFPVAQGLVEQYGGLSDVVRAAQWNDPSFPVELRPQVLVLHAVMAELSREMILGREVVGNFDTVLNFCRVQMAHVPYENLYCIFLDKRNAVLAAECLGVGTVDQAPVYPRMVAVRALALNATAIVMAHNHPSGDPHPSRADIAATQSTQAALKALGISLHDHVIVSATGHYSFRTHGDL